MNKEQINENDSTVANFVQKAFEIISDEQNLQFIEWLANGKQFIIKNIQQFEEIILPKYFRHRNINSFIRQLNMYGFHKSRQEPSKNIFSHPFFQRGKREMLSNVKRKLKLTQNVNETPQKHKAIQKIVQVGFSIKQQDKTEQKKQFIKKQEAFNSQISIKLHSLSHFEKDQISPLKNLLVSRSLIMDLNLDGNFQNRQNGLIIDQEQQDQDDLSIADQINQERHRFNNRTQGIAIVKTSNFLSDFKI